MPKVVEEASSSARSSITTTLEGEPWARSSKLGSRWKICLYTTKDARISTSFMSTASVAYGSNEDKH